MRNLLKKSIEHLWPIQCLLCDGLSINQKFICDDCFEILPKHKSACKQCGLPITESDNKIPCGSCMANPPPFDNTFSLFQYAAPISSLITKLKFHGDLSIAKLFSHYWINFLSEKKTLPELIIPKPLHYKRLKERGFNQALEIAKPIGKHFQITIDTKSCIKLKNTAPQSSLSAAMRRQNLKNGFALSYSITAKHVAILDDVMTTGNTVSEMSQLLRISGVERVDIWCCARA
ncbi:MAG: ComF family protein [Gammaproteobacteria bacterium]|nr:ComF family protein [Gammaproteobacteria bacterium]